MQNGQGCFGIPKKSQSFIFLYGGNGAGSSATCIRRFTNASVTGSALIYNDSPSSGGSITVAVGGVYAISYTDQSAGATTCNMGITINENLANTGTTGGINVTPAQGTIKLTTAVSGLAGNVSVTLPLNVGDVIRAHGDVNTNATNNTPSLTVTQVS